MLLSRGTRIHFIGVAGIGMSAIAQFLSSGYKVSGSDRNFDNGVNLDFKALLEECNITILKQDGTGVTSDIDIVIYSTSIEDNIPDLQKARDLNITCIHRSDMLASILNDNYGIAISGTNGKTTTSGFIGYMLYNSGFFPKVINGGKLLNFTELGLIGNAYSGDGGYTVIEADESDGTLVKYKPSISVITNIGLDHKPIEELYSLFTTFANNAKEHLILNADCLNTKNILHSVTTKNIITFGSSSGANYVVNDIVLRKDSSSFSVNGNRFNINIVGYHNILNSIPSIIIADILGIRKSLIKGSVARFKGIERRLNIVNNIKGIDIIDDYSHNPYKIMAAIDSTKIGRDNIIVIFQPHGYEPTKLMKDRYIKTFIEHLTDKDIVFIPEILYQGGTVDKTISSKEIVEAINNKANNRAYFFYDRSDIITFLRDNHYLLEDKQAILVMGARDNTLRSFAKGIEF